VTDNVRATRFASASKDIHLIQELNLLRGKQILIIEDEHLVETDMLLALEQHGAKIVGPIRSIATALDCVDEKNLDAVILDIDIDGEAVYPLTEMLCEREITFIFATGCSASAIPEKYPGFVLCEKPTELAAIAVALFAPRKSLH
jgi:CO dehydrogenase/acetyl-CoA synthase alpha subunit